jgi:ABC-type sulfate transport system substrate-binding protein
MRIRLTVEEMIKAKFTKTIKKIEGYYEEACGDVEVDQSYGASAVKSRMGNIRDAFNEDIKSLVASIDLEADLVQDYHDVMKEVREHGQTGFQPITTPPSSPSNTFRREGEEPSRFGQRVTHTEHEI